jgi:hypothetical protein
MNRRLRLRPPKQRLAQRSGRMQHRPTIAEQATIARIRFATERYGRGMAQFECPIWQTPATLVDSGGGQMIVDSPRAGGLYFLDAIGNGKIVSFTDDAKLLLTTWLCDQRRAGVDTPKIGENALEIVQSRSRLQVSEKLTRGLQFLESRIKRLGDHVRLGDGGPLSLASLAATECLNGREQYALYKMLDSMGMLNGAIYQSGEIDIAPSSSGWTELFRLNEAATKIDSSQAFVAMWFNTQMDDAYVNGLLPAITRSGYKSVRIDKKEHNNKIDDEIVAEIRKSRFLIADFTCEPEKARGGVYYEAGFAHGLGIPVIWTCREDSFAYVHFDTRQYAHIVWKHPADLFEQLKNRIGATVGVGPIRV